MSGRYMMNGSYMTDNPYALSRFPGAVILDMRYELVYHPDSIS